MYCYGLHFVLRWRLWFLHYKISVANFYDGKYFIRHRWHAAVSGALSSQGGDPPIYSLCRCLPVCDNVCWKIHDGEGGHQGLGDSMGGRGPGWKHWGGCRNIYGSTSAVFINILFVLCFKETDNEPTFSEVIVHLREQLSILVETVPSLRSESDNVS